MLFHGVSPARSVDELDFSDITDCNRTGPAVWLDDGVLDIPFAQDPSPEEAARIAIRLVSATPEDERARLFINDARVADDEFLNQQEPRTPEQIEAQLVAMTAQFRAAWDLIAVRTDRNA